MVNKEWPKLAHLVFTIVVALVTIGASWGAARAEAASTQEAVAVAQQELKVLKDAIQSLTTNGAVNQEVVRNINEKLGRIQEQLDEMDKKIDRIPKGGIK